MAHGVEIKHDSTWVKVEVFQIADTAITFRSSLLLNRTVRDHVRDDVSRLGRFDSKDEILQHRLNNNSQAWGQSMKKGNEPVCWDRLLVSCKSPAPRWRSKDFPTIVQHKCCFLRFDPYRELRVRPPFQSHTAYQVNSSTSELQNHVIVERQKGPDTQRKLVTKQIG